MILEEHGVLGEANITALDLHFIPLEPDLLSLELEDSLSDLSLRKDPTSIFASAQALMRLQKQYGLFPRVLGKGDNAEKLADLLQRMREEEDVNASSDPSNTYLTSFGLTPSAVVENLVIIDREVDFPTTLATQLTYEGLLDEVFGIANNQTEVDTSILGSAAPQGQQAQQQPSTQAGGGATAGATKRKIQLDSSDKLYPAIRDANFAIIGPLLNRTARRLQGEQQSIKNTEQSITDLRTAVAKLPAYQAEQAALKIHTSLAEEVAKFTGSETFRKTLEVEQNLLIGSDPGPLHDLIEELIARDTPLRTVLRLLCLEACLHNGLRSRDLDSFKRQILQAYGYQHALTLANLEKMSLLFSREAHRGFLNPIAGSAGQTATDWNALRKGLALWVDDVREDEPVDVAYVFSGWAPLSVRLVQAVLLKGSLQVLVNPSRNNGLAPPLAMGGSAGWKGFEDVLARLRGATVDLVQEGSDVEASQARRALRGGSGGGGGGGGGGAGGGSGNGSGAGREGPKTTLVFFLGGVTYAEIAALRFVGRQLEKGGEGRKLVVCTTGIVGGRKVVDIAVEKRGFGG